MHENRNESVMTENNNSDVKSADKSADKVEANKPDPTKTDTASEPEVKPEETKPAKDIPAVETLGEPTALVSIVLDRAKGLYSDIVAVAAKQDAAGNVGQILQDALTNSTDPKVKSLMSRIEKANQVIIDSTKEAEALVKPTLDIPTEDEVKALDESYKALASQIKTFDTVFVNEVKGKFPDLSIFDYVGELPKGKRSTSTGAKAGQGEGSSRPRVSEVAVSTDDGKTYKKVEKDGKSTFSVLVAWLKKETGESISAGDLHEEWYKQNGNASDWTNLPEQTTFNYSLNSKNFFIRVTK